ncbi:MAG: tRNA pseudouridine(55) synthase TruB [Desulfobacterales bacterium]|nr:MAG: tRNA pseudouridine(55) synthase TruB [Desulfobacterales bacterium]
MVTEEKQQRKDYFEQGASYQLAVASNQVPVSRNLRPETSDPAELNGIIIIDKPGDMSSAKAVATVKRLLNAKKVGHTGTLDPFAHGVLVCCVNRATRLAQFLLHGEKKYVATLKLGEETDTQDSTGTIVAVSDLMDLSDKAIQAAFNRFTGSIEQLPPVYSALKHKGVPLYKLARRGQPFQKQPRHVYISDIHIREINIPIVEFEVTCSAGTYIRTLCADIGRSLGCGGHLQALQRVESSGFTIDQAASLTELEESASAGHVTNLMISMTDALGDMPAHIADQQLIGRIRHGMRLTQTDLKPERRVSGITHPQPYIKIVDSRDNLIAVLEYTKGKNQLNYCCVLSA